MNLKLTVFSILFSCSSLHSMESGEHTFNLDQFEQDLQSAGSFAQELHERIAQEPYDPAFTKCDEMGFWYKTVEKDSGWLGKDSQITFVPFEQANTLLCSRSSKNWTTSLIYYDVKNKKAIKTEIEGLFNKSYHTDSPEKFWIATEGNLRNHNSGFEITAHLSGIGLYELKEGRFQLVENSYEYYDAIKKENTKNGITTLDPYNYSFKPPSSNITLHIPTSKIEEKASTITIPAHLFWGMAVYKGTAAHIKINPCMPDVVFIEHERKASAYNVKTEELKHLGDPRVDRHFTGVNFENIIIENNHHSLLTLKNDAITCLALRAQAQTWLENDTLNIEDGLAIFRNLLDPNLVKNPKDILHWDIQKTSKDHKPLLAQVYEKISELDSDGNAKEEIKNLALPMQHQEQLKKQYENERNKREEAERNRPLWKRMAVKLLEGTLVGIFYSGRSTYRGAKALISNIKQHRIKYGCLVVASAGAWYYWTKLRK